MSEPVPFSVLIPTLNEAGNIRDCIGSVRTAAEIVVIDSGSTDGTQEIAKELGARVVNFEWNGRLPKKKNWALANVEWANEWVFILDADERFDANLMGEVKKILTSPQPSIMGYYVNRRFWFLDGWLNHCGYYPSWNLRFFKHRFGRYELLPNVEDTGSGDNEVHEHVNLDGEAGHLTAELEHYAFPSISVWVEKHNRYSNWEARIDIDESATKSAKTAKIDPALARKRRLKHMARRLPFRPLLRFIYHYVLRGGFRDGYRGFVFCRLMGIYEFLSAAKGHELRRQNHNPR